MNRRQFSGLFGGFVAAAPLVVRASRPSSVIVVGAGAAGLTAAYHLKRAGADVRILEASNRWGGRVMRDTGLADVPLDLGAEWIHAEPTVLGEMLGAGETSLGIETIEYRPQTYQSWHKGKLRNFNAARHAYAEVKFKDTTWYGFFERQVVPSVSESLVLNAPVAGISVERDGVTVIDRAGRRHEADQVLLTVPISALKSGDIVLEGVDASSLGSLEDVQFGQGLKVFMRFSERFYPDLLYEGSRMSILEDTWDSKIYYDAVFRKPTAAHVLALFNVSEGALPRARLTDEAILEVSLDELSEMFGNVVRQSFQRGIVQNWSREPFIGGSYSMSNWSDEDITDILAPLEGRIHFAGEVLGGDAQSTVHGAAFSAMSAVEAMVAG